MNTMKKAYPNHLRQRGFSLMGQTWLVACVSLAFWMLVRANASAPSPTCHASQRTAAIEDVRVGQRVVTPHTRPGEVLPTAVDASIWRLLTLKLVNRWPDGTVNEMRVRTLQPQSWLTAHGARVGATVPLPLDLEEMGVSPQPAVVLGIEPCSPIETKPGRVVLTTVNHLNVFLFDLTLRDGTAQPELVQVNGWHELYSEDRRAWLSVCELRDGERLRGRDGVLTVASLVRQPGTQRVYNMTVEGEHVYYVSAAGVLAHNLQCNQMDKEIDRDQAPRGIERADKGKIPGEQDQVHVNDGAINEDGTWKYEPAKPLNNKQRGWLDKWGVGGG